jgi:hypothetical protein
LINYSEDTSLYELETLKYVNIFSKNNPNCNILYLHTKGVSYNYEINNILDWTNMMLYYLLKVDDEDLERFEVLGCNYSLLPSAHFSGNFWWSTSNHLCLLDINLLHVKHDAEWWLFSVPCIYSELYNSGVNHYNTSFPTERYMV